MFRLQFLSLIVVVLLLAGCCAVPFRTQLAPSGPLVTKDYDLSNFTAVAAGSAFEVEIARSDSYSVSVTVNESLVESLEVNVSGNTLHISLKPDVGLTGAATMKAKVTMPELTGLDLSGASRTTLAGFNSGKSLKSEVSGASMLRGGLTCGDASFNVSGASKVNLNGSAQDLKVEALGRKHRGLEQLRLAEHRGQRQTAPARSTRPQRIVGRGGQRRLDCALYR